MKKSKLQASKTRAAFNSKHPLSIKHTGAPSESRVRHLRGPTQREARLSGGTFKVILASIPTFTKCHSTPK